MILDNRAIIAWIIWMKMRIWNQTCQKLKNQSSINGEKKWNSQRKLFHHNALALWEMFRFRPKISFTNFRLNFEHFNETWKAELRELKKVSVKDKIAAFSSKVEKKPAKKIGSLSQSKWRSSSLRKAGYWLAKFYPIRMLFQLSNEFIASENIHMYL